MLFFLLYKIGEVLALIFPVKISYKVASFLSDINYIFSPCERREMLENLRVVLPEEDPKVLKRYSRQIFKNFSRYLVDFFRFKKLDLKYIKEHIEIVNKDYIDEVLKKQKGLIVVTAHLGSWELGGVIMSMLGYHFNAVAMDHKNKLVNNFFVRQREIKNEKVISMAFALRRCFSALENNEVLAIVGDKDFTNSGVVVKFFGKDAILPKGPASLSLKTGARIITGFTIRTKDDNFKLVFEKPIEFIQSGDFDKDVIALMGCYVKRLEDCIRRYPTQWCCFRKFWQ